MLSVLASSLWCEAVIQKKYCISHKATLTAAVMTLSEKEKVGMQGLVQKTPSFLAFFDSV